MTNHPASALVAAWERQQEAYIRHREQRFELMLDLVEQFVASPSPRVLDLACGPGSVTRRVLHRFPQAEVVGLDLDPVLLELGRRSLTGQPVTWVKADLRSPDWPGKLPTGRFDAVLSTTALHWLSPAELSALYAQLPTLLASGGVFLNGDYLPAAEPDGRITAALEAVAEARRLQAVAAGADDWDGWWSHVRSEPGFAAQFRAHDELFADRAAGQPSPTLQDHLEALAAAGFGEVELVWHDLTEGLICALN